MNKLLMILLAICLVSVHARVKREDAPTTENVVANIQKSFNDIGEQIKQAVNPEKINAGLETLKLEITKGIENIKSSFSGEKKP